LDLIPVEVRAVMLRLEELDARDREEGIPRSARLRAIRPEVGQFLLTLALATGAQTIVEVGTSAGYSALWLAVAARRNGGRVTTFEIDPVKVALAEANFAQAGVADAVELRDEDGGAGLARFAGDADLVFLDSEKEQYEAFLEPAVQALRRGGSLVADNLVSHAEVLEGFRRAALGHPQLCGLVVPIGRGELLAVRVAPSP
jgi:caffeoyl-CoA O-methyltransferase